MVLWSHFLLVNFLTILNRLTVQKQAVIYKIQHHIQLNAMLCAKPSFFLLKLRKPALTGLQIRFSIYRPVQQKSEQLDLLHHSTVCAKRNPGEDV